MTIKYVDLSIVKIARENPRKTRTKESIATLAESLLAVGIIHSLSAYEENGFVHVTAGGTRIAALRLLAKDAAANKRAVDKSLYTQIPIDIQPKERAVDIALTSNEVSTVMTLAEQFRAYNTLSKQGVTAEEIASRYYTDKAQVIRILALANLHKPIFAAFEKGEIELDVAKVYAGTNQAKQVAVWEKLGSDARAHSVRTAIRENTYKANDKIVVFIGGVDAYTAKGGAIEADLFSKETVLCNGDIVTALFDERVEAIEAEFKADGWENVVFADTLSWEAKDKLTRRLESVRPVTKMDKPTRARFKKDEAELKVLYRKHNDSKLTEKEAKRAQVLEGSIAHLHSMFTKVPKKYREVGTMLWSIRHDGKISQSGYKPDTSKAAAKGKAKKAVSYPASFVEASNRTAGQALMDKFVASPNRLAMCMALALLDRVAGGGISAKVSECGNLKYSYEGYTEDDRKFEWNDPSADLSEKMTELMAMTDEQIYAYSARMMRRGFDATMMGTLETGREDIRKVYSMVSKSCEFNLADYWIMGEDELKALTKPQLLRCMSEIGFDISAYDKSKKSELVKVFARYAAQTKWTPDFIRTHAPIKKPKAKATKTKNTSQAVA